MAKPVVGEPARAPSTVTKPSGRGEVAIDKTASEDGTLTATLSAASVVTTNAAVTALDAKATQALLARMEPLPTVTNAAAPVIRPASQPPPRSGTVTPIAFVAPAGKQVTDKPVTPTQSLAPLEPPQVLPVGEVERESEIRVRFGEPMVAVAAVGTAAALPITIKPTIAGSWRWIDTRVAQFTAKAPRLPAATEFTVTVPAGVKAVSGATLVSEVTQTFSTPPVMITGTYPTVQLRPDSPIVIKFDQQIDPAAIQKFLRVEQIKRKQPLPFQIITLDAARTTWAKNPSIKFALADLGNYYIVIAPKTAWPSGVEGRVVLAKQAPSKEGPRVTARATAAAFTIAKRFTALGVQCNDMQAPRVTGATCSANGSLSVEFSNDIDPATYRSSKVQIEGQPLLDHKPYGERVGLWTPLAVGRTFTIPIGDGIKDVYGQELTGPRKLSFTTSRERFDSYLWARDGMFVLDPRFDIPQWVVSTQAISSLHVQLFKVEPKDYFAYTEFERGKRATPPGKKVWDKEYAVGPRHAANARVDLRPALSANGNGHLIAVATVAPAGQKLEDKKRLAWIQVSRVGVTARIDGERVNAWAQDITPSRFLKPIPGVKATLLVDGRTDATAANTDNEGHAGFELLPRKDRKPKDDEEWDDVDALLLVEQGDQSTFTPIHTYEKSVREQHARWYVTDDRFTYKPGEPVYVKGWVRWTHTGVNPDLSLPATSDAIAYTLNDSRGNKIASGKTSFTAQGGFDLEVTLPPNVNLGTAYFQFETKGEAHRHPISVQEFRTPAYAVTLNDDVTHSGATPLVLGESIEMNAEAKYYAGGGLAGAAIKWHANLVQAAYRPPGWDRYTFSPISKRSEREYYWRRRTGEHATSVDQESTLSGASAAGITYGLAALPGGEPSVLTVDATVTDIDRQTIRASSRSILVHPSTLYVGVRLMPDNDDTLQLVATDIDGNAVAGVPIEVTIEGVLGSELYRDDAIVVDTQRCKATSETTPVTCHFTRKDIQTAYVAVARVADSRGRVNAAQYYIPWWTWADNDFGVVADKKTYKPGDIAKLDVRSKELPSVAVVSFARNGIIVQKRVELTKPSTTVELPIEPAYIQNVHVVVDRAAKRRYMRGPSNLPLPEQQSAHLELAVDVESARLAMRTRPLQSLVEPGENATFEVEVKHDDKPKAGAEVALMVVDEAVLALSSKTHEDPLANFYSAVGDGTWTTSTLGLVEDSGDELDGKPGFERWSLDDGLHGSGTGSGMGYGSGRGGMAGRSVSAPSVRVGEAVVKARKDFRATAVFSPKLTTDEHGKVRLTVKMPDSLTRFRVVALATSNTRYFGKAENAIVTQRKVNARTVAPRFLTQGDTFSLPIVVQNLDRAPRTIDVAVRAANLTLAGAAGKRVTVPGGQRAEVRFDFSTLARGRAVIQTIATSGSFADASNIELPVYEPATTEAFATYGTVDDKPQFEQLKVPGDIFADVGGVEAEVASTQLQNLTDAYWYLYKYPFECAEQRSSRMLATSALYDILDAFATPGRPSKQEIADQRARDVKKLTRDQLASGGWGYFRGMDADPFVTMQVLTALAAQKESGPVVKNAIGYVTKQANQLQAKLDKRVKEQDAQRKDRADDAYSVSLLAASLTSLASTGLDVGPRADKLHAAATALGVYPIDAKARVLAQVAQQPKRKAMREKLLADLLSAVHETAGAATVTTQYAESERLLLVSNHKTTALALDAIMREQPQHALVTKLARGLLDGRRRGRWMSTQENVVVLQAMRRYFDTYEKDTPNYTGKLWFGNAAYAEQAFVGRSNTRGVSQLDWSTLAPGTTHDLVMTKSGPGRMYYRIGITYAPKQTNLPPLDAGFIVRRTYRAADDPKDVVQLPDGRVKIKLGARVVVEVEAVNTSLRYAVALVDPLPAGLESVNTSLATSERAAAGTTSADWQHLEMRDNRSEAFTMHLREGTHRFSYTARATTPGTFIAAPAKAEEMYSPETFGRSAGTTVVVE